MARWRPDIHLPEINKGEMASLLPPMPVPEIMYQAVKFKSDQAMRMALDAGLPISASYRFDSTSPELDRLAELHNTCSGDKTSSIN